MTLRRETQARYDELVAAMAASYEVADPTQMFTATVPTGNRFQDAVQAASDFLQRISIIYPTDIKDQIVQQTIASSLAKRTQVTTSNPRQPTIAGDPTGRTFECKPTEFDVALPYALLDNWARFPDFAPRYMRAVYRRIALDRILIGFRGTSCAAATDRASNPLLQDVNTGWIFDLLTNNAANYYLGEDVAAEGEDESIKIQIGETGAYQNVHQLVQSIYDLIDEEHLTGGEIAIIGKSLIAADKNKILGDNGTTPTEIAHFNLLGKSYAGIPSVTVPGFPSYGVLITDPANLQIAIQQGSMRRQAKDEPQFNRKVDYISDNECYHLGNLKAAAGLNSDNVEFV
jgi:P2 family phage major capsid protein